jgi:hypothetical protein
MAGDRELIFDVVSAFIAYSSHIQEAVIFLSACQKVFATLSDFVCIMCVEKEYYQFCCVNHRVLNFIIRIIMHPSAIW